MNGAMVYWQERSFACEGLFIRREVLNGWGNKLKWFIGKCGK